MSLRQARAMNKVARLGKPGILILMQAVSPRGARGLAVFGVFLSDAGRVPAR